MPNAQVIYGTQNLGIPRNSGEQQPALAGAYNFGPHTHEAASVRQIIHRARKAFQRGEILWGDGTEGPHEAGWLALEIAKAQHRLGVCPRWTLQEELKGPGSIYFFC